MESSGIEARRQAKKEDGSANYIARRQEIVQAAAQVFRDRGYEATLKDVAQALGTDRASLYYYFGSKEELLQEVVRAALALYLDAAQAIHSSRDSVPDKIRALIHSMVLSFDKNYPHMSVYIEDLGRIARQDSGWAVEVIEGTREYEAIIRAILRQGQEDGTVRADIPTNVASMALFGMINWMYRWYRPSYPVSPEEIANSFVAIFLSGFAVSESDRSTETGARTS